MENSNSSIKNKIMAFFRDSIWSISALVLINVVAQFIVYPFWNRAFGDEIYGDILYAMSIITVPAVSIGVSANYSRMRESSQGETVNGDYNTVLLVCGILTGIVTYVLLHLSGRRMSSEEQILGAILSVFTMWRYYADVEYRLSLNYRRYFVYYAIIAGGYFVGILLFRATRLWPLALLPGEIAGLVFVILTGNLFTKDPFRRSPRFRNNINVIMVLVASNLISNIIFNGDRLTLELVIGGTAVTIYYLASLVGKTMSLITTPLNSVIIGYLSRFQGNITRKHVHIFAMATLGAILLSTAVCVVGSHILLPILYPASYAGVVEFIIIASGTQVIYFVTNIVTTVLLRISQVRAQLIINVCYAICFAGLCIPGAKIYGVKGFCIALFLTNTIRYLVGIFLCYRGQKKLALQG